jgi:hypothetical protein
MANPLKGEVELVAGDKSYVLKFSVDAICSLEERLDKGFPAIAVDLQQPHKLTISLVRQLLHASLNEAHPEITLKEAGELIIPAGGMVVVLDKVSAAISAAFPAPAEARGTSRPPKRLKGQTGLNS